MNEKLYSIKIKDKNDTLIGERMDATSSDILRYMSLGFLIYDQHGNPIEEAMVTSTLGVSDGLIET